MYVCVCVWYIFVGFLFFKLLCMCLWRFEEGIYVCNDYVELKIIFLKIFINNKEFCCLGNYYYFFCLYFSCKLIL